MAQLLARRIGAVRSVLRRFLSGEATGGLLLIAAAALALVAANSTAAPAYFGLLDWRTGPVLAPELGAMTVQLWINDGLMAVFFLLVGLEIKRELVDGGLATPARRRLPMIAAAAGMVAPMLVYLAVTGGDPALRRGWAVPAATDIAFAIGVLALLGRRVPASLKLLLTAIAIVDDLGAVAIIALGYSHGLNLVALAAAAAIAAAMWAINRMGVRRLPPYLVGFAALWLAVLQSGVHATVAGVIAAMVIPVGDRGSGDEPDRPSPLHRLEHALTPWVAFGVVPVFGFANAGVALGGAARLAGEPLVIGIAAGLFLGKQLGIFGAIRAAAWAGIARRPAGTTWVQVWGMALVAGIGFTMSLFIGGLAFTDPAHGDAVKLGVLTGSLLSAVTGAIVLRFAAPAGESE